MLDPQKTTHTSPWRARYGVPSLFEYLWFFFIKFRKAIDTVEYSILLYKLYHYGVRGPAYDWFCDYLYNKIQFVSFNDVHSQKMFASCGIP